MAESNKHINHKRTHDRNVTMKRLLILLITAFISLSATAQLDNSVKADIQKQGFIQSLKQGDIDAAADHYLRYEKLTSSIPPRLQIEASKVFVAKQDLFQAKDILENFLNQEKKGTENYKMGLKLYASLEQRLDSDPETHAARRLKIKYGLPIRPKTLDNEIFVAELYANPVAESLAANLNPSYHGYNAGYGGGYAQDMRSKKLLRGTLIYRVENKDFSSLSELEEILESSDGDTVAIVFKSNSNSSAQYSSMALNKTKYNAVYNKNYNVGAQTCFIATAAYGTPFEKEVLTLRQFREKFLLTNQAGSWFVDKYYQYSPPIANKIAENENAKSAVRVLLKPFAIVASLMLEYGVLVLAPILLLVGLFLYTITRFIRVFRPFIRLDHFSRRLAS